MCCGLAAAYAHSGFKALRHGLPAILIIGSLMSGTQYLLATNGLWNLAGFVAGLVGLLAGAVVARLPLYRSDSVTSTTAESHLDLSLPLALTPYLLLIVLVTAAELYGPLHEFLNSVVIKIRFPTVGLPPR